MKERTMFAVIADQLSTKVMKITQEKYISELSSQEVYTIIECLTEVNPIWDDVLTRKRVSVLFDAESGVKISINRNSEKFIIELLKIASLKLLKAI